MGQKTNPNILRIGNVKEWQSKYIEKKTTESPFIIFQDLEIKKFISRLFTKHNLRVQNCKTYRSESSLHVYISYHSLTKPLIALEKVKLHKANHSSISFQKNIEKIRKRTIKKQFYVTKASKKAFCSISKLRFFQKHYITTKKTHRLNHIKNFKNYLDEKNSKTLDCQNKNVFISKLLKNLSLFSNKKCNIFLNLKQINKETELIQSMSKKDKQKLRENFIKLRRYQKNEFFKKGFNMLYNFTKNSSDPTFLAEFIAFYLRKLKRPNFFLRFLKLALKILIARKFSKLERIQIKIKGRFNGAPRSSHKFLNMGKNIPILTLNSNINYGESTAFSSNGTFGVKVWTYVPN